MARRSAALAGAMPRSGGRSARADEARRAARSGGRQAGGLVDLLGRLGFACRGLIYVIVGALAVAVAAGRSNAETDRQGALHKIADKPFGTALLVVLIIGFFGYAAWRVSEAIRGDKVGQRIASAARAVLYVAFAISTIRFLTSGSSGGSNNPQPWTARLMEHDAGRFLVGAAGIVLVGAGAVIAYRGVRRKFEKKLKTEEMGPTVRKVVVGSGVGGHVARGVVYALVGVFLTKAAVQFDPKEAKGIDQSLKTLAGLSYGPVLLGLVAAGLILFGAYSFASGRYRRM